MLGVQGVLMAGFLRERVLTRGKCGFKTGFRVVSAFGGGRSRTGEAKQLPPGSLVHPRQPLPLRKSGA